MIVTAIVALAENRVIGREGTLPWHLPADLKHFKTLTTGHHIIMGRKTWESLPNGPLPKRTHLVISRGAPAIPEGVRVLHRLSDALEIAYRAGESEVFIIGGAQIYTLALPWVDRLQLTEVGVSPSGDVYFPELREENWTEVSTEAHPADDRNPHPYVFRTLERHTPRPAGFFPWRTNDY